MIETVKQIEAVPATYPAMPGGLSDAAQLLHSAALWARIESHIAHRFTTREVVWILDGCGDWTVPLTPATITASERWNGEAWEAYTGRMKWDRKAPEKFHDAASIREQWYVGGALAGLACYTLFILIRTSRRRLAIEAEEIITQDGRRVRLADLTRLDLRKWPTKGLAYAYYPLGTGKEGRIRIDGLTYGGFQAEQGEPAEQLMRLLRENFTGELVEYADADTAEAGKTQA